MPGVRGYRPVASKAQSRALFAKAARHEMSESEARGKTRAAHFDKLPERKTARRSTRRR